jgi:hypothetical protein
MLWLCYTIGVTTAAMRRLIQKLSPADRALVSHRCDTLTRVVATSQEDRERQEFAAFMLIHDLV